MANFEHTCKICGVKYKACTATRLVEGVFRWKDVACCPEHGQEYLRRVLIARGELKEDVVRAKEPTSTKTKSSHSKKKTEAEEISEVDSAESTPDDIVIDEIVAITEE